MAKTIATALAISALSEMTINGEMPVEFDVTLNAGDTRKGLQGQGHSPEEIKKIMKEYAHTVKGTVSFEGMTGKDILELAVEAIVIKARPGWYKAPSDEALAGFLSTGPVEIEAKSPAKTPWNAGDGKRGPKAKGFDVEKFDPSSLSDEVLAALKAKLGL